MTEAPESRGANKQPWTWLPTPDGAVRRDLVRSVSVERIDGDFKGGYTSMWTVQVHIQDQPGAIRLRPVFFEASELCRWVDIVWPGAAFSLLPPDVVAKSSNVEVDPEGTVGVRDLSGRGQTIAQAIRSIGEGLGGGDAYTPDQGYRPPAGAPPRRI